MIKMLAPALPHPTNRTMDQFRHYWQNSHGPLFANNRWLRRYVQHINLPELNADDQIHCTYAGCSMFWYDSLDDLRHLADEPDDARLWQAAMADDRQLFDRATSWPTHERFAMIIGEEIVLRDAPTEAAMVKAIWTLSRRPGLTPDHCFDQWAGPMAELVLAVPGLGRYVQNHVVPEAHEVRGLTHDGWSEMWFDDLDSLRRGFASPQWDQVLEARASLFAEPVGLCVATEHVQKEFGTIPRTWTDGLTESQIQQRLRAQGYTDPTAPELARRVRDADQQHLVAVWTEEHLVVLTEPVLDLRPSRTP